MKTVIYRSVLLLVASLSLSGCITQKPKWMVEFFSDAKEFNQTFTNNNNAVLYGHMVNGLLQIDHFDSEGTNTHTTSLQVSPDESKGFVSLNNGSFFTSGSTTSTITFVDSTAETFWQGVTLTDLAENEAFDIVGIYNHQNNLAIYGAVQSSGSDIRAMIVILDSQGVEVSRFVEATAPRFTSVITEPGGNIALTTSSNEIITLTESFIELGRFSLPSGKALASLSIDHPILVESNGNDIQRYDANGTLAWTYDSPDIPNIKGYSSDIEGNLVFWGDVSNFNLLNMKTDKVSYEKLTLDGARQWLFQSDNELNVIKYLNIDHRSNGETTISFQGWKGELAGLLIGGNTETPVRVTRTIQHDTISKAGKRVTHRVEPSRTEVYSQCGFLCIEISTETTGHCESIDITYINKNIAALSKVCGEGIEDTVKLSYF